MSHATCRGAARCGRRTAISADADRARRDYAAAGACAARRLHTATLRVPLITGCIDAAQDCSVSPANTISQADPGIPVLAEAILKHEPGSRARHGPAARVVGRRRPGQLVEETETLEQARAALARPKGVVMSDATWATPTLLRKWLRLRPLRLRHARSTGFRRRGALRPGKTVLDVCDGTERCPPLCRSGSPSSPWTSRGDARQGATQVRCPDDPFRTDGRAAVGTPMTRSTTRDLARPPDMRAGAGAGAARGGAGHGSASSSWTTIFRGDPAAPRLDRRVDSRVGLLPPLCGGRARGGVRGGRAGGFPRRRKGLPLFAVYTFDLRAASGAGR